VPEPADRTTPHAGPAAAPAARAPLRGRWTLAVVLVLATLVLAAGLGLREPMPPDEPRFALMARDMVHSGEWLFPRRGDELYAHKPPVFMWLQALAYAAIGDLPVAFLLPSLLAALATLALVFDLARRLWGPRAAPWAALALLATVQFALQARRGQIDAVVAAMMTASMYGLLRHHLLAGGRRWGLLGWFMAGLGTITKGVGFLPLLVLPLLAWARWRGWRHLPAGAGPRLAWWAGPLAFIAATALWLAPMLAAVVSSDDPAVHAYARDLLLRQTATRYLDPWHHHQPVWYFLQVIATLWLPFALALPGLLPAWWGRLRGGDARVLALVGWALLVLLFFSASPGKREVYILPALPMLCVAAAPWLPLLLRSAWLRRAVLAFVLAVALAALAVVLAAVMDANWLGAALARRGLDRLPDGVMLGLASVAAVGLVAAAVAGTRRAGHAALALLGALWLAHGLAIMPALSPSSSGQALMRTVETRLGPASELALLGWPEQLLLQATPPVTVFGFERPTDEQWPLALDWLRGDPQRRWLLVRDDLLPACLSAEAVVAAGTSNRRDFVLVAGRTLPAACDAAAGPAIRAAARPPPTAAPQPPAEPPPPTPPRVSASGSSSRSSSAIDRPVVSRATSLIGRPSL
jgi:4-amino-4-deoxy-L-arabinose transferase-like glycosyltransferase